MRQQMIGDAAEEQFQEISVFESADQQARRDDESGVVTFGSHATGQIAAAIVQKKGLTARLALFPNLDGTRDPLEPLQRRTFFNIPEHLQIDFFSRSNHPFRIGANMRGRHRTLDCVRSIFGDIKAKLDARRIGKQGENIGSSGETARLFAENGTGLDARRQTCANAVRTVNIGPPSAMFLTSPLARSCMPLLWQDRTKYPASWACGRFEN